MSCLPAKRGCRRLINFTWYRLIFYVVIFLFNSCGDGIEVIISSEKSFHQLETVSRITLQYNVPRSIERLFENDSRHAALFSELCNRGRDLVDEPV